MEEIQNTMSFIAGQVFSDEEEAKKEIKRMVATETEKVILSAPTRGEAKNLLKKEEKLWKINEVISENPSFFRQMG